MTNPTPNNSTGKSLLRFLHRNGGPPLRRFQAIPDQLAPAAKGLSRRVGRFRHPASTRSRYGEEARIWV